MPFLKRPEREAQQLEKTASPPVPKGEQKITALAIFMGLVASIGGFMFGFVSGQISGFFAMPDYAQRFGELNAAGTAYEFSAVRQGTIVALLCAGCLFGALIAGNIADTLGRRLAISASAFFSCIGIVIEVTSMTTWYQFAIGRMVNGFGIGALSVLVPMYQSESSPAIIRGLVISSYQLFITFGILVAYLIDFGTRSIGSSAEWRIPNAISLLWAIILGVGILFLPESPRFAYRRGREEEARTTIAKLAGLEPYSREVSSQITEIRVKVDEERAGDDVKWHQIFTAPTMLRRTLLGIVLQAGQQLTGANFFFYYGTTVFAGAGLKDSYVTQIILGAVNVFCTFGALYLVQKCGRRLALMVGAAWIAMCLFIYAFVGHFALDAVNPERTPAAGNVLIVFSCLAIASFAITWGPLVWAVVAELYPAKYRAQCMALATASNWLWNFLISFFTTFITRKIDYLYGLVFACSCVGMVIVVFFFLIESKERSLEEIDTMYLLGVNPITSAKWDGSKVPESAETSGQSSFAEQGGAVQRVPAKEIADV